MKVRGVRVELGEIEAALLDQPGIVNAAVLPVDGGRGALQLVAYVQPGAGAAASAAQLRAALMERLPHAMVPSRFVLLDHMPMTVSGKVDRERLPSAGCADARAALSCRGPDPPTA